MDPTIIKIDDVKYDLSDASSETRALVESLRVLDRMCAERHNLRAVLLRSKNAYISDLKSEIISNVSGFDASE